MSVILSIIGNRIYLVVGIPAPMFNVYSGVTRLGVVTVSLVVLQQLSLLEIEEGL